MKRLWRNTLLCFLLAALLLAQFPALAFAVDAEPEIWFLKGGVPDENGVWTSEYWVDANGNRKEEAPPQKRLRAAANLPRSFDARDYGLVTSVKNQAGAGNCWAFSAIASLESSYIRQGFGTLEDTDFSEAHLVWFGMRQRTQDTTDPTYGDGSECEKPFLTLGNWLIAGSAIMRGSGLQLEQNAPWITTYNENRLMDMAQEESDRYVSYARLWNVEKISDNAPQTLKQKILQNGAATLSYYDDYTEYQQGYITKSSYTSDKSCYYQTKHSDTNHTVTVVGWDDDFPRARFRDDQQPSADGAWLIKGSWSTLWGDRGYYWISYEDPSISQFAAYTAAPADIYDHIYQYDGAYTSISFGIPNSGKMANRFTAERDELMTHVVFYSLNETPVKATIDVYVAPEGTHPTYTNPTTGMQKVSAATTTVSSVGWGYYTAKLNSPVLLSEDQAFTVVVTMELSGAKVQIPAEGFTVENPGDGVMTYSGNVGESFISYNNTWYDTNNYPNSVKDYNNVPVKAMTRDIPSENPSLTLVSPPEKTTYLVGETLDTTGMSFVYTDENGNASLVTGGFTSDISVFNEPGAQTVTVTYGGLSASFEAKAILNEPTLSLASAPATTAYMVGDTLDTTGLSLVYTDEYGAQSTVTDGFFYSPHTLQSIGTKTVDVTYNDLSVSFDVTSEAYETSMTLTSAPRKTTYYINETLNTSGLTLNYTDEFNRQHVVTKGFTCSPQTFSSDGTQTVTATYKDRSVTFDVSVEMYEPTLTVVTEPDKTSYYIDETLDTTGLSLVYMNEYGDEMTVTAGFSCDPLTFSEFGTQIVTVEFNDTTTSFEVEVEPYEPTLTVQSAPDKTTYYVGETLSTEGLTLLYTDEYGDALVVTEGFTCDVDTLGQAGTQTVTAAYNGLSATFDVTVKPIGLFLVSDAAAKAGETIDVAVRLQDNPGIVSAWLELDYDTQTLELIGVQNGEIFADTCFTPTGDLTAVPFRALFQDPLSQTNYTQDGDLVVFTFRVRTDAPAGATTIRLTYKESSTCDVDLQNVPFTVQDGTCTVERTPGDVNADGFVDMKDVIMLRRYLAGWGVTINLSNADVDAQEDVDLRDVTYITRFLAGGYGLILH